MKGNARKAMQSNKVFFIPKNHEYVQSTPRKNGGQRRTPQALSWTKLRKSIVGEMVRSFSQEPLLNFN
jgi:ribosomal protein L24E